MAVKGRLKNLCTTWYEYVDVQDRFSPVSPEACALRCHTPRLVLALRVGREDLHASVWWLQGPRI